MNYSAQSAYQAICSLEKLGFQYRFNASIDLWPLIRQSVWLCIIRGGIPKQSQNIFSRIFYLLRRFYQVLCSYRFRASLTGTESIAFFSRSVYLQFIDGKSTDRVVDPLLFCTPNGIKSAKYYLSSWSIGCTLNFPGFILLPGNSPNTLTLSPHQLIALDEISNILDINSDLLIKQTLESLVEFSRWYSYGQIFFKKRHSLKFIFVSSWYFPDVMGLIAAAHLLGIKSVDIQHGKQGKYQPMYSGWQIPESGYALMPDFFWCWGQKSVDHILSSSPNRKTHLPIIGGYPWLEYSTRILNPKSTFLNSDFSIRIIFTLQPPSQQNANPIPDFVVDFLSDPPDDCFILFRIHPNHRNALFYCQERLSSCSSSSYLIDDGKSSLYELMSSCTHHLTAFSSCCFEASELGLPTLLYGEASRLLYSDEILDKTFSWTSGNIKDLVSWFRDPNIKTTPSGYFESSLSLSFNVISSFVG